MPPLGMHPPRRKRPDPPDVLKTFRELATHPKVLALGEMGLDYYRNLSPRPLQKEAFEKQLDPRRRDADADYHSQPGCIYGYPADLRSATRKNPRRVALLYR